jgi:hypothetical protein
MRRIASIERGYLSSILVSQYILLVIGRLYRETDTVLKKTVDTHKILINAIHFCNKDVIL